MAAPSRDALERLHAVLAESLTEVLAQGVAVRETDKRTGEVREIARAPAPAPYILAAVRFLKDNGVRAASPQADALADALGELPRFDDEDDDPDPDDVDPDDGAWIDRDAGV